jgi:hypothetical protein
MTIFAQLKNEMHYQLGILHPVHALHSNVDMHVLPAFPQMTVK